MIREYKESEWPEDRWPNFSHAEMRCSQTGMCRLDDEFMDKLQKLREAVGKPLTITSGYRSIDHTIEAAKIEDSKPAGSHTTGKAVDVACERGFAYQVLFAAIKLGFTGIGVQQSGSRRFLHLDTVGVDDNFHVPRPALWSY
jgi:uncharacterized protein YcbK (DUF882 family)